MQTLVLISCDPKGSRPDVAREVRRFGRCSVLNECRMAHVGV